MAGANAGGMGRAYQTKQGQLTQIKARRVSSTESSHQEVAMEMHPFVWFVVGLMTTFAVVLGGVALISRSK